MNNSRPYHYALDIIRFFVACALVFCHLRILRHFRAESSGLSVDYFYQISKGLISVFFAQSGFLIAWSLIREHEDFSAINLTSFFKRRIIRVWPLYSALCLFVFFIFPYFPSFSLDEPSKELQEHFFTKVFLYFSFMPQINLLFYSFPVYGADQLWSIGVEWLFYMIIPFFFVILPVRKPLAYVSLLMICLFVLLRNLTFYFSGFSHSPFTQKFLYSVFLFFYYTRLECLFIGVFIALAVREKKNIVFKFIQQPGLYWVLTVFFLIPFFIPSCWFFIDYFYYSLLSSIFTARVFISNYRESYLYESVALFMGKVTYGIYITHFLILIFLVNLFPDWSDTVIYAVAIPIILTLSYLLHHLIEKPFQRFLA